MLLLLPPVCVHSRGLCGTQKRPRAWRSQSQRCAKHSTAQAAGRAELLQHGRTLPAYDYVARGRRHRRACVASVRKLCFHVVAVAVARRLASRRVVCLPLPPPALCPHSKPSCKAGGPQRGPCQMPLPASSTPTPQHSSHSSAGPGQSPPCPPGRAAGPSLYYCTPACPKADTHTAAAGATMSTSPPTTPQPTRAGTATKLLGPEPGCPLGLDSLRRGVRTAGACPATAKHGMLRCMCAGAAAA